MWALVTIALAWACCGAFAYGLTLAYFQRKYPMLARAAYAEDVRFALLMGVTGPFGLLASVIKGGWRYGIKWR